MQALLYCLIPHSLGKNFPPEDPNDDPRGLGVTAITAIILTLSVLFITSLIGYFWIRKAALARGTWVDLGIARIPTMMYYSTASLLLCSVTFHRSLQIYRAGNLTRFRRLITITFLFAIGFLFFQFGSWLQMVRQNLTPQTPNLYSFMFYFLSVLHILHVFVGIVPLTKLTYRAYQIEKSNRYENYMILTSIYWHFLDVVWLILFGVLYFY